MNSKIDHIKNLVYFAFVNNEPRFGPSNHHNFSRTMAFVIGGLLLMSLNSCKKDPIVITNPTTDGKLLDFIVKNSGMLNITNTPQDGYHFALEMNIKNPDSLQQYLNKPAMVRVPVTTWKTGTSTTKTVESPVELKMANGKFVVVSPIPLTAGESGSVSSGARLVVGDNNEKEEFNLDELSQEGQLIDPDDALIYFNAPFMLHDFSGVTDALFDASTNPYGDTSQNYTVANYTPTQLNDYVINYLTSRGVSGDRLNKLVGMLTNETYKQRTQNGNSDLMATGIFWAAEDKTDGVYKALTGQSSAKYRLSFVDALPDNAKMNVSVINGEWVVRIRRNAYPSTSPVHLGYVVTNNEWTDIGLTQNNRYVQNIEDMLGHLQYARDLATLPEAEAQALFAQKNPTVQASNVAQLDLLGSGMDMQADLPTIFREQLRGKGAKYANKGSYEETVDSGNVGNSNTATANVTNSMKQRLKDTVGLEDEQIPTQWSPTDLTFYNLAKQAIRAKYSEYMSDVAARFKLDPQSN